MANQTIRLSSSQRSDPEIHRLTLCHDGIRQSICRRQTPASKPGPPTTQADRYYDSPALERLETPPSPSVLIPFSHDTDFVARGARLEQIQQIQQKCAAPGSQTRCISIKSTIGMRRSICGLSRQRIRFVLHKHGDVAPQKYPNLVVRKPGLNFFRF